MALELKRESRSACRISLAFGAALSCFGSACLAQTQDGAWEGPYSPIPLHPYAGYEHCCEIAHAILIAKPGLTQGKVLLIQSNGDRWMWDPAAPNSVGTETYCDQEPEDNMFCAGHSADSNGSPTTGTPTT